METIILAYMGIGVLVGIVNIFQYVAYLSKSITIADSIFIGLATSIVWIGSGAVLWPLMLGGLEKDTPTANDIKRAS